MGITVPAPDFQQWTQLCGSCWRFPSQQAGSYKGLQRQNQGTRTQEEAVDTVQLRQLCKEPRQLGKTRWRKEVRMFPIQGKHLNFTVYVQPTWLRGAACDSIIDWTCVLAALRSRRVWWDMSAACRNRNITSVFLDQLACKKVFLTLVSHSKRAISSTTQGTSWYSWSCFVYLSLRSVSEWEKRLSSLLHHV